MPIEFNAPSTETVQLSAPYHRLKLWYKLATRAEKLEFERAVGISRSYIRAIYAQQRNPPMAVALRIEAATQAAAASSAGRLPLVTRYHLVPACRACELAAASNEGI